jgi:hypothetical protein
MAAVDNSLQELLTERDVARLLKLSVGLRGHLKTGQLGSPENRPVERIQDTLFLPHL